MHPPRMTMRRWITVVAVVAMLFTVMPWVRCDSGRHPYYWANKAATLRRYERWASEQVASARASAEEYRRTARTAATADRDRLESAAKRYEKEALLWEERANAASREAMQCFRISRESGYRPSELPAHIRREMKSEDLE